MSSDGTATNKAARVRSRRHPLHRVSAFVLVGLLVIAIAGSLATQRVVAHQEKRALVERSAELDALLQNAFAQSQTTLNSLGVARTSTTADIALFNRTAEPLIASGQYGAVALVHRDGDNYIVDASLGSSPNIGATLSGPAIDAVSTSRSPQAKGPLRVGSSSVIPVGDQRRLGLAMQPNIAAPGTYVYVESILRPFNPANSNNSAAYNEVKVALYTGSEPDPSQAVLTSTNDLPLSGPKSDRFLNVGDRQFLLQVEARRPLLGTLAHNLPLILLVGSVAVAILVTVILETIARRRDYAMALVEEQTHELKEARDLAMETSRLKSEFVANMSHEIRTPMNGVIGMTELLMTTEQTSQQLDYTTTIRTSADALLNVINDILDFSKIEAGKLELTKADFAIQSLLEEVTALLATSAHGKGIELILDVDSEVPPWLIGDSGRIRQILLNLAGNAVKFTDQGEVTIRVRSLGTSDSRTKLHFEVADTGPGVSAERIDVLFESFSQGDASSTRTHGGTGLGLAISKRLVEMMNGSIGVESTVGAGSCFWFEIELDQSKTDRPSTIDYSPLDGIQVLLADDNKTNLEVLQRMLESWRMTSTTVNNSADIERILKTGKPFDVAIVDYQMMANAAGLEIQSLQVDPRYAAMKWIFLATALDNAPRMSPETTRLVAKPARKSMLLNAISDLLVPSVDLNSSAKFTDPATREIVLDGADRRALMAEDNAVNQVVGRAMLESLGYTVDVANNGHQALDAITNGNYQVVFMDCQMPELDGYETTRQLRKLEQGNKHTPVIALTASAMEGDAERCFAAGMDDYLAKPVRIEELQRVLTKWVTSPQQLKSN